MEMLAAFRTLNLRNGSLSIDLITEAFLSHDRAPSMLKLRPAELAHHKPVIVVGELFDHRCLLSILYVTTRYNLSF